MADVSLGDDVPHPANRRESRLSARISGIEKAVAAGAMAAICLISFANALIRYLTNYSFAFTEEVSVILMVLLTLVGASTGFALGFHIRITILVDRLPPRLRRAAEALSQLASAAMFGLLVYYGYYFFRDDWEFGVTTPSLGLPQWIYSVWLPLLSLVIVARIAMASFRSSDVQGGGDERS